MVGFTKDEMLDELRVIFLYEAEHIALGHSPKMAEQFIGLSWEEHGMDYTRVDPKLVDLGPFQITQAFERCYDYAFNPSPLNASNGEETWETHAFMEGTPKMGSVHSADMHAFMTPEGLCRTTSDAATARLELDKGSGSTFSVRDLALLADMTEGAVRNAMSLAGDGGLTPIKGSKPARVDYEDAIKWLHSRRGFVPTPPRPQDDTYLQERIRTADTFPRLVSVLYAKAEASYTEGEHHQYLGDGLRSFLRKVGLRSWDDLPLELRGLDLGRIRQIGEALDLDVPLFASKVVELGLRAQIAEGQP